jgi:hypothetical protein
MQKTKKSKKEKRMEIHREQAAVMMRQVLQADLAHTEHRLSKQPPLQAALGSTNAANPCSSRSLYGLL